MNTAERQRGPVRRGWWRPTTFPNRRGWVVGSLAVSLALHGALLLVLPAPDGHGQATIRELLLSLVVPAAPTVEPAEVEPAPLPRAERPATPVDSAPPTSEPAPAESAPAAVIAAPTAAPEETAPLAGPDEPPRAAPVAAPVPGGTAGESPGEATPDSGPVAGNTVVPDPSPTPVPVPPPAETTVDTAALLRQYAGGIKAAVLANKRYPARAERLRHTGAVKVGFTVKADGTLSGVTVNESAGYSDLDSAATAAVEAAAPFAAIPAELGRDSLTLSITLDFRLE